MTQTADTVLVIGRVLSFCTLVRLSIVVGVVVVNERGREVSSAGGRYGIGGRCFEVVVEGFPFLKEGGGPCSVLLRVRNEDAGFVIVVEWIDDSGGVGCGKLPGREFT